MNVLVLKPDRNFLEYGFFSDGKRSASLYGSIKGFRTGYTIEETLNLVLAKVVSGGCRIDAVAIHVEFGGTRLTAPVTVSPETVAYLETLVPAAPMHIPPVLELISGCSRSLPKGSVILFFETAFFVNLPEQECLYAIDPDIQSYSLRRYGYNGLFHEAACASLPKNVARKARTVSICLEPHPEIAAVVDNWPVMVSGGSTPLEGLPGHTSCGEIDSGLLLSLSRKEHWGPEQINTLLTQKSGLLGLTGQPVTLPDVMLSDREEVRLAHNVMLYRILQQTGMALAAMNGFDRIVFSGRYAKIGKELGPWLIARLPSIRESEEPLWSYFETPLMKIMADQISGSES
jgi:acetate kinase